MSNKTSDKNVGSIEDDVRILFNLKCYLESLLASGQDKIFYNDLLYDEKTIDCINAIEDLLKERKKYTIRLTDEEYRRVIDIEQKDIVEQKDKRIQELEEKLLDIIQGTEIINKETPEYVKENYIPKQVIEDKIKDLRNDLKYIDCNSDCSKCFNKEGKALYRGPDFNFCFAYYQIKGLQELLEEGERK